MSIDDLRYTGKKFTKKIGLTYILDNYDKIITQINRSSNSHFTFEKDENDYFIRTDKYIDLIKNDPIVIIGKPEYYAGIVVLVLRLGVYVIVAQNLIKDNHLLQF